MTDPADLGVIVILWRQCNVTIRGATIYCNRAVALTDGTEAP